MTCAEMYNYLVESVLCCEATIAEYKTKMSDSSLSSMSDSEKKSLAEEMRKKYYNLQDLIPSYKNTIEDRKNKISKIEAERDDALSKVEHESDKEVIRDKANESIEEHKTYIKKHEDNIKKTNAELEFLDSSIKKLTNGDDVLTREDYEKSKQETQQNAMKKNKAYENEIRREKITAAVTRGRKKEMVRNAVANPVNAVKRITSNIANRVRAHDDAPVKTSS